jgi:hypothetical protein
MYTISAEASIVQTLNAFACSKHWNNCFCCVRANIQENIELIKLQRELREKSTSLTQIHAKYTDLDEVNYLVLGSAAAVFTVSSLIIV